MAAGSPERKNDLQTTAIKPATTDTETWNDVTEAAADFKAQCRELHRETERQIARAESARDAATESKMRILQDTVNDHATSIRSTIEESDPDWISWVEPRRRAAASIRRIPLRVGPILTKNLFGRRKSVIVTSATLTTSAGDFTHLQEHIGAPDARTLALDSPFDYENQARLLQPRDMPNPRQFRKYEDSIGRALEEITTALDGHTLALFTSNAAIKAAKERLAPALGGQGIKTLAQNIDGGPVDLLRAYRASPKSIILGTNSFWEGIDLAEPGILKAVVICKLPFPVPTDPIIEARSNLYRNPFGDYHVPMAVMRFRQGFGRLIRNSQSKGAIIILDPRFDHPRYGYLFQSAIPRCDEPASELRDIARLAKEWLQ